MSRFPNKQIKLNHVNGTVVNYGPLVNGLIDGIKVLAHKEVLILLKIQLVTGKVKYFASHTRLSVRITDVLDGSLYLVHEHDMPRLVEALKRRQRYAMRQLLLGQRDGGVSWENMPIAPVVLEGVRMEKVHEKQRKPGKLQKFWLLVKQLFRKEKPEGETMNLSALKEVLRMASQPKRE